MSVDATESSDGQTAKVQDATTTAEQVDSPKPRRRGPPLTERPVWLDQDAEGRTVGPWVSRKG